MFEKWKTSSNITHVLMDGGTLSVPFDRLNEFYEEYVQCIKDRKNIFVVEQKTVNYNFFMDLDYVDDVEIDLNVVKEITLLICENLKNMCKTKTAIISVSKPKPKNDLVKTGIHINWPGCVVDQTNALYIRQHIIKLMNGIYSAKKWDDIIDKSVYGSIETGARGSGFRMPWSHKKTKHTYCGGKGCAGCNNTGKITEHPYLPVFMYNDGYMIELDQSPTVERLLSVTVRTEQKPNVCVPEINGPFVKVKREGNFTKKQTKNEYDNIEIIPYIETFIRKHMKGQENSRIQKVYMDGTSYLIKTNSKYCENIGREHNSNHIFFVITKNGCISHRCFCRCDTTQGRRYGFCKNFSSTPHNLTKHIVDTLYPGKLEKIKNSIYTHLKDIKL